MKQWLPALGLITGISSCHMARQQVPVQEYVPPTLEEATTTSEVLGHFKLALLDCDTQIPFIAGLRERFTGCGIEFLGQGGSCTGSRQIFGIHNR